MMIQKSSNKKNQTLKSQWRVFHHIIGAILESFFDVNHFEVLDFLRKHKIIIVVDGFENNWQGNNSSIIKDNLDTMEQR